MLAFHLPLKHVFQDMLRSGDSVLWTPALFAGFDLHGEGQLGMFHPLNQALYRALPLDVALNLQIAAAYVTALAGMYWFLRRLLIAPAAAEFGAMTFAFGGFMLMHYPHVNLIAVVAHLPAVLGCCDVLAVETGRSRRALAYASLALLTASQILLGFPQGVWWTLVAAVPFLIWRARQAGRTRRALAGGLAIATGLLIGGVQLVPTMAAAARSGRIRETQAFFLSYSLHPWNLVQLWSPYTLASGAYTALDYLQVHEFALYPSAFLSIAPVWLWVRRGALRSQRPLIAAAGVFGAVMLVLALGRYGGAARALTFLPFVGSFRAPARYVVLLQFALAILAAVAIEDLAAVPPGGIRLSRRAWAAICAMALLNLATIFVMNGGILRVRSDLAIAPIGAASRGSMLMIGATALVLLASRGRRWAVPLLVVLTAIDLGTWGMRELYAHPPEPIPALRVPMPDPPGGRPMRLLAANRYGDAPLLNGYQIVGGYVGLYPEMHLPIQSDAYHRLAGAQRRIDPRLQVTDLSDAVPRARLLADTRISRDPAADIRSIDVQTTALVGQPLPALGGPPGTAVVTTDRPGRLGVATRAAGRQLLSVSERFDEGWTAAIDGSPADVVRINADFIGVVVSPGSHLVELRFEPAAFRTGLLASLAGAGLLAGALGAILRR